MEDDEVITVETDYHFSMVPEWVFERLKDDSSSLLLYVFLSLRVYSNEGWSMSRQSIADALGWSLSTVDRKTKSLVEARVLKVQETRQSAGVQGWNKYIVMRQSVTRASPTGRHQRRSGGRTNDALVASPVRPIHRPKKVNPSKNTTTTQQPKTSSSKVLPNKHAGACIRCGWWVDVGGGSFAKNGKGEWQPVHLPGQCISKTGKMLPSDYENKNPEDWTTL